jgi:hypothetical protein
LLAGVLDRRRRRPDARCAEMRSASPSTGQAPEPRVRGPRRRWALFRWAQAKLFLGNAGTAFRPLTAALALSNGHYTSCPACRGCTNGRSVISSTRCACSGPTSAISAHRRFPPPLEIGHRRRDPARSGARVRGDVSSQFLTAMLMALAADRRTARSSSKSSASSSPSPISTITTQHDGALRRRVERDGWRAFTHRRRKRATRSPGRMFVEGDASSASYFLRGRRHRRRAGARRGVSGGTASRATCASPRSLAADGRRA